MRRTLYILFAMFVSLFSYGQTLEWMVKDTYADIKYMGNDVFKVKNLDGKWAIVNKYGQLSDFVCDSITNFTEERALLLDATGNFLRGIINQDGIIIKEFHRDIRLANCQAFNEGYLPYGEPGGIYYKFGYINRDGQTVIEPRYDWAAPFHDGRAVVKYANGRQEFGLINKYGETVINYDKPIKFMSTPVNNEFLMAISARLDDKLVIASIDIDGSITFVDVLEKKAMVNVSDHMKSISCNGITYNLDDNLRLISSSTGRQFNTPVYNGNNLNDMGPGLFSKIHNGNGFKIAYNREIILHSTFSKIEFYSNKYAVVTNNHNQKGILKLFQNSSIEIVSLPNIVEFYHNLPITSKIGVNTRGISPASSIQIKIKGLRNTGEDISFNIRGGHDDIHSCPISYFIENNSRINSEVLKPITIDVYLDGMLIRSVKHTIKAIHMEGFKISGISAPEYSESDNSANLSFYITPQNCDFAPKADVTISGSTNRTFENVEIPKNGKTFTLKVMVPKNEIKSFNLNITIKEAGCPEQQESRNCTIKNYFLK